MIKITGPSLAGDINSLQVTENDVFVLYQHEDSCKPVNIPLQAKNIFIKEHSFTYNPIRSQKDLHKGCYVCLGDKPGVNIVEHLFSALYGLALFQVQIDVYGRAIPFFDGSSREFAKSLAIISHAPPEPLNIDKVIEVQHEETFIRYEPCQGEKLIINMELKHPYIGRQIVTLEVDRESYIREIAPARTFVFTDEDDPRLKNLPHYGIGVTPYRMYSSEPPRFPDELVRHKILDLLGDLYVLQGRLTGKITGSNTHHRLNMKFAEKLLINMEGR
jgi:UDP-3-O-[3-hydroxymyristoyl] N-acetylglucosamine deacetylase